MKEIEMYLPGDNTPAILSILHNYCGTDFTICVKAHMKSDDDNNGAHVHVSIHYDSCTKSADFHSSDFVIYNKGSAILNVPETFFIPHVCFSYTTYCDDRYDTIGILKIKVDNDLRLYNLLEGEGDPEDRQF